MFHTIYSPNYQHIKHSGTGIGYLPSLSETPGSTAIKIISSEKKGGMNYFINLALLP